MGLLDRAALRLLEQVRLRVNPKASSTNQGGQRSKVHGSGHEFAEQREYVPGDDARRIDWKAFARNRSLTVRTFEEERDVRIYVLLDVSHSMARGTPPKLEVGRQVAASFGYLGMKQMERVQVIPFADSIETASRVLRRTEDFPALEQFLRNIPSHGVTTFAKTARTFVQRYPGRGLLVVVSDLMESEDWSGSVRMLAQQGHQLCVVRVRCEEDAEPTFQGELELRDAETGETLRVTVTRELIEEYQKEIAAHVEQTRDVCRRVGASLVEAAVEQPFDQLLRQVLAPALEQR